MKETTAHAVQALRKGDFESARRVVHNISGERPAGSRDLHRDVSNTVFLLYISSVAAAGLALAAVEQQGEEVGGAGGSRRDAVVFLLDQAREDCSELIKTASEASTPRP